MTISARRRRRTIRTQLINVLRPFAARRRQRVKNNGDAVDNNEPSK